MICTMFRVMVQSIRPMFAGSFARSLHHLHHVLVIGMSRKSRETPQRNPTHARMRARQLENMVQMVQSSSVSPIVA
jgi:hypothetical protein